MFAARVRPHGYEFLALLLILSSVGLTQLGCGASKGGTKNPPPNAKQILYLADSGNNVVRKITPAGAVAILAGSVKDFGNVDGPGPSARFGWLGGLARICCSTYGNGCSGTHSGCLCPSTSPIRPAG